MATKETTVDASIEKGEVLTAFVESMLEPYEPSPKATIQVDVAIDEVFSNIVQYSGAKGARFSLARYSLIISRQCSRQSDSFEPAFSFVLELELSVSVETVVLELELSVSSVTFVPELESSEQPVTASAKNAAARTARPVKVLNMDFINTP